MDRQIWLDELEDELRQRQHQFNLKMLRGMLKGAFFWALFGLVATEFWIQASK